VSGESGKEASAAGAGVVSPARAGRYALLGVPIGFVLAFLLVPIGLTFVISFWEKAGFKIRPAFTLVSYEAFFTGVRLTVLETSLVLAVTVTALGLLMAYPVAYFLSMRVRKTISEPFLILFAVPFLINPIIRNFSLAYLLGRNGPVNQALIGLGLVDKPLDWLLFSDFAVVLGLVVTYMPFMIYPLWLSLTGIDRQLIEASYMLGARPSTTFLRVTLPLSLPGIFAAGIFGFVGTFGESTVPIILGGLGYQLMGNTITSSLDVLNYPLAAAMSSVVVASMLVFLMVWYRLFDIQAFLGKIVHWRY
jgi:ABC-type spermidine/putrescine transport system permease subunit I